MPAAGRCSATLRAQGSAGLHLLVADSNQAAMGFYRHLGFTELPGNDPHIFVMRLAGPDS